MFRIYPNVKLSKGLKVCGIIDIKIDPRSIITLGKNLRINSGSLNNPVGGYRRTILNVNKSARLNIGNNVGISSSSIHCTEEIIIGDDVLIGGACVIFDSDFHAISYEDRILKGNRNVVSKPIIIGKGVFIGTQCIVSKGIEIGNYSIIAAGSVVNKNIPSMEIWGGNPIKFIKKIEDEA